MNQLITQIIGTVVRAGLTALSAFLIQRRLMTSEQAGQLSSMLFDQIINALPAAAALAWSAWQKYKSRSKLLTALMLPPGSTENCLHAYIASGAATPVITTPPNTSPGVPEAQPKKEQNDK